MNIAVTVKQVVDTAAKIALGWAVEELDQFVIHQVSQPHTAAFIKNFGENLNGVIEGVDDKAKKTTMNIKILNIS